MFIARFSKYKVLRDPWQTARLLFHIKVKEIPAAMSCCVLLEHARFDVSLFETSN